MAVNRFVLNTISYHGKGAIKEIPGEISRPRLQEGHRVPPTPTSSSLA